MNRALRSYSAAYLALLALLGLTLGAAYARLGALNTVAGMGIALAKGTIIALCFMRIRRSSGLQRVFAAAGLFWLGILFSLALSDYFTRGMTDLPGHWPQRGEDPLKLAPHAVPKN